MHETVGVVDALGVTGNLGANDPGRVAVIGGAVHPTDPIVAHQLDVKRTGRRTIVRADRMANGNLGGGVHGRPSAARIASTLTEFAALAKKCRTRPQGMSGRSVSPGVMPNCVSMQCTCPRWCVW